MAERKSKKANPAARPATVPPDGDGQGEARRGPAAKPMVMRSMPESLPAEAAVLGSMIVDPRCIGDVVETLDRNAFYHSEHQMLYDAIVSLYEKNRGEGIDGVLVRNELERRNQMEAIGGIEYLQRVIETVPSSANVQYYADIVREKMLLRETIAAASDILNNAYDEAGDASEKLDEAERKIFAVTDKRITSSAVALKDLVTRAYELIEKREGTHVTGLGTGYYELDDTTCGLQDGEMIIVAGRPSMGKTALALNIAEHIGIVDKTPLAIFSLEMGRQQLAERFLCSYSGVDAQLVRKGMLSTEHYQKLVEACGVISEGPIYIDDTSALTPLELRAKARRLKSSYGIRCIILDYLQLMAVGAMRVESRQQEISTISRYLKSLARELSVPVVVLSQLNRSPEGREGHRPRMSDLRESGCLAGDSRVTLADTGQRVPIRELPGRKGFSVWSLNLQTLKLEPVEVTNAFSTGTKPVFRLTTRLGRSIRTTANHRFFTLDGWMRLDELHRGTRIALPRQRHGVSMRAMQAGIGTAFGGSTLYKTGVSRQRLARVAEVVPDPLLRVLAESHVYWDQIVSVEPDGEEQVYDLTVQRNANFLANDIVVHNSIEQDADVVMLLHREDYYHRGEDGYEPDNTAEVIIAKQRNGPTGTVKLTFREKCTRFENQSIAPAGQEAVPF